MSLLRLARVSAAGVLTLATLATGTAVATTSADAATIALPHAPVALPSAIETMPPYQPQTFCNPVDKPGPKALGALLTATYHDTTVVDISRPCGSDTSEHYDGRALDWGASITNPQQVKEVNAVFAWLFAKDAAGNPNAMLRRLGIMYIIWNKRIWGSWSQSWQPYSCSGVTACHQDHVHFSLDWAGAEQKTSFWTGKVAGTVAPPTFLYTSTVYSQTTKVPARSAGVTTPYAVKAGLRYHVTITGTYRYAAASATNTLAHVADAECSTVTGTHWQALAPGETSASTGLLDLWIGNQRAWTPSPVSASGCNIRTHTYTGTIAPTTTATLRLHVNDLTPADDSGTLTVTIQRV